MNLNVTPALSLSPPPRRGEGGGRNLHSDEVTRESAPWGCHVSRLRRGTALPASGRSVLSVPAAEAPGDTLLSAKATPLCQATEMEKVRLLIALMICFAVYFVPLVWHIFLGRGFWYYVSVGTPKCMQKYFPFLQNYLSCWSLLIRRERFSSFNLFCMVRASQKLNFQDDNRNKQVIIVNVVLIDFNSTDS